MHRHGLRLDEARDLNCDAVAPPRSGRRYGGAHRPANPDRGRDRPGVDRNRIAPHAIPPPFFLIKGYFRTYVDLSIHGSMLICQYSTASYLAMPAPCSVTSLGRRLKRLAAPSVTRQ